MPEDDKYYRDTVIRITHLVERDGILDGFTFENCQIDGPAVLVVQGEQTVLASNDLGANLDAVLWDPRIVRRLLGQFWP